MQHVDPLLPLGSGIGVVDEPFAAYLHEDVVLFAEKVSVVGSSSLSRKGKIDMRIDQKKNTP